MNVSSRSGARMRVFSGIQPTGVPHIGNYLGAIRNWVRGQDAHESLVCVVDLHAITVPWDPGKLRDETLKVGASLLACGIDPGRAILFVQSHVPAHAQLAWVLTCIARMGELRRMVQFKERSRGDVESIGAGLLTYPVLQAADVLLYRAQAVPVGEDQRQHVELMRDLAGRFNATLGQVFVLPDVWVPPVGARIMALDDPAQKMSKSAARPASSISVADTPDAIVRKVRAAVTDSGREVRGGADKPALDNLLTIFSLLEEVPVGELEQRFDGAGYGSFKESLAEVIAERLGPIRVRFEELMDDPAETARVLEAGADRASGIASSTLARVYELVGFGAVGAAQSRPSAGVLG